MNWIKRNIDIILILTLGFLLRFTISFTHSYSNDELSAVNRLRYTNFSDLIEFGVQNDDMHPAGVQVFMKGWSLLVGKSEIAMRFPFVLFGTAAIFVLFLIGKQWFNRKVGLIAAGLLAVLYFPIMNSEFARPYSPGLLILLLVGLYFHKVLFKKEGKTKNAIILGILFALGMYTHYFAFLFVAFIGFTGLFFLNAKNWKPYVFSGVLGILFFLPHIYITSYHLSVGGLEWLAPPENTWLFQFLFHSFNSSWFVVVPIIVLSIMGLDQIKSEVLNKRNLILITIWFFGIYGLGHILSLFSTPVLKFPVMLFAFPYFLLLIATMISKLKWAKLGLVGLMVITLSSTILEKDLYGNKHFALFKKMGIAMARANSLFGAENIYTIYNVNNPDYINFYANNWNNDSIKFDWSELVFDSDIPLRNDLKTRTEEYCLVGYSSRITLVQVFETVKEFYPQIIASRKYNNCALFLLKKGNGKSRVAAKKIELSRFDNLSQYGVWEYKEEYKKAVAKMESSYFLDSTNLVGPTFNFKSENLPDIENAYILVEVDALIRIGGQLTVTFTGERNGEIIKHRNEPMWIGHDLEPMLTPFKPSKSYYAFKIPYFILPQDELKISLWNRRPAPMTILSFRIYYVENIWN